MIKAKVIKIMQSTRKYEITICSTFLTTIIICVGLYLIVIPTCHTYNHNSWHRSTRDILDESRVWMYEDTYVSPLNTLHDNVTKLCQRITYDLAFVDLIILVDNSRFVNL